MPDMPPFARKVFPGVYPVDLYIAKTPTWGERVAVAMLTFAEGTASRYELALRGKQAFEDLEDERSYYGFPVDAGLGSFFDQRTGQLYAKFTDKFYSESPDGNIYDDFLASRFKENARSPDNPDDPGDWLDFHLPDTPTHNIPMFQSGYGDGLYPAYWGVDTRGNILNLVIDFHVLLLPDYPD